MPLVFTQVTVLHMNSSIIFEEAEVLKKICFEENISQDTWGARMHFLRWKYPITLRALQRQTWTMIAQ